MPIDDDDRRAFEEATRDVRPLKPANRTAATGRARPEPRARLSRAARAALLEESLCDGEAVRAGEEIAYRRAALPERTFRKLRRGEFSIEAEIDLHGHTRGEARLELKRFLAECIERRLGCVRVIHGKGARSGPDGPVLKASVQRWLQQWDDVLAFVSAGRQHGGSGAVYVLLKHRC